MTSAADIAAVLERAKPSAAGAFVACCPAHDDSSPSLSIADGERGPVVHCHAGCSQDAVLEALATLGVDLRRPKANGHGVEHHDEPEVFNVAALAHAKMLSAEKMRGWRVQDVKLNDGASAVGFEYRDRNGNVTGMKIRRGLTGNRGFIWRQSSTPSLYGLWRLEEMFALDGRIVICEGETDALTLWQHEFSALGLPGASQWKEEWLAELPENAPIYVIIEPDQGGETVEKWLAKSELKHRAHLVRMPKELKDPSALFIADDEHFADRFEAMLKAAVPAVSKPDRQPMRWTELLGKTPAPRSWRISHWLTAGPTLFAGAGGVGKTLIAQTIATALALGRNFVDNVVEAVPVLMWACEDDHDELWRRQLAICAYFGVALSDLEGKLIIEPRLGRENTLFSLAYGAPMWTPLRDELVAQVRDYGSRVVFLDNIGQLYGGKESERHQVTSFLNGLMGLAPDISVIVMGHPSKSVDSEFSGSTAWENGVRMRWYLGYRLPDQKAEDQDEEDPNVRFLAKRKTNYSDKDFRRLEFRDGLFVPENAQGSFADRWGGVDRKKGAEDCILNALAQFAQANIRTTDGKTSGDYLPRKMRDMKLTRDYSPKELTTALGQLRLAGRIVLAEKNEFGKYSNGMTKSGLMLSV